MINFSVNGKAVHVSPSESHKSLGRFLREDLLLTGAKLSCGDGACGTCVVAATRWSSSSQKLETFTINACLRSVNACDGLHIITIEALGGRKAGYGEIQKRIASEFGTQCGFCTPGFIMSAYGYLHSSLPVAVIASLENSKHALDESKVMKCFDGNICRCTGYRPIVSFLSKLLRDQSNGDLEIEDLGKKLAESCSENQVSPKTQFTTADGFEWYQPKSLAGLKDALTEAPQACLVAGSTVLGLTSRRVNAASFVDLNHVEELKVLKVSDDSQGRVVDIGGAVPLSQMIEQFESLAKSDAEFSYLEKLALHLSLVGTVPVRNVATWAGNLAYTREHPRFASDVLALFEAVGASVVLWSTETKTEKSLSPLEYVQAGSTLGSHVLLCLRVKPKLPSFFVFAERTMPRALGTLTSAGVVIAASLSSDKASVVGRPSIVAIGLPGVSRLDGAEAALEDSRFDGGDFEKLMTATDKDSQPASGARRFEAKLRSLKNILFRFWADVAGDKSVPTATILDRHVCQGEQKFEASTDKSGYGKPIEKLESGGQVSGEAKFTADIAPVAGELHAIYVRTKQANVPIIQIETEDALKCSGVVRILTVDDIPGTNHVNPNPVNDYFVLADKFSKWCGQGAAIVLAESEMQGRFAAEKVKIIYGEREGKLALTLTEAIEQNIVFMEDPKAKIIGDVDGGFAASDHVVEGVVDLGGQAHFFLEPSAALARPSLDVDGGVEVTFTTQSLCETHHYISTATGLPQNMVHVSTPRVGGGFGGKAGINDMPGVAAGLACHLTGRPVRLVLTTNECLDLLAKRIEMLARYKVGVGADGKLKAIQMNVYHDSGAESSEAWMYTFVLLLGLDSCYYCPAWKVGLHVMRTHHVGGTFMRAPIHLPAVAMIESVLEHVARVTQHPVTFVRESNFVQPGQPMLFGPSVVDGEQLLKVWNHFKKTSDWEKRSREVTEFNRTHRWRKRGLSVIPARYGILFFNQTHTVKIAIYKHDGSVNISSGAIELGQGTNTKLAQVVARELGCPLDVIKVRQPDTFMNTNTDPTGGSINTEIAAMAFIQASKQIKDRLLVVRETEAVKNAPDDWKVLIAEANNAHVDLSATSRYLGTFDGKSIEYSTYSTVACESEVDVLSGETKMCRVDILHDCGRSINPMIDIGQIEGAFIQGVGYFMSERIEYDPRTGRLIQNSALVCPVLSRFRCNNYHVPTALDIPEDFRVEILPDNPNTVGIISAKGMGEPPIVCAASAVFATREAINSARKDVGFPPLVNVQTPMTNEEVVILCGTDDAALIAAARASRSPRRAAPVSAAGQQEQLVYVESTTG